MGIGTHDEWMRVADARANGSAGHAADGRIGSFYDKEVFDKAESAKQDRAVYKLVPYVEILLPGTPNQRPNLRATDEHKRWFPGAWQAYRERKTGLVDGTPIQLWPYLDRAQVAELKAAGVHSIEQLAAVPDGSLKNLGPHGRELRTRAEQHLKPPNEVVQDLRAALSDAHAQIASLEAKIEQMLAGAPDPAKPKRGRPRKAA